MPVDRNKIQQQAEKLIVQGKVEAGIAQYQLLVNDNPRDLGTLNKIGDLFVRINKKADAIKAYARIADIYSGDGFFLKAIAIYKKITKIDPSHLETLQSLADLYSRQGLKTEARAQYLVVADALMKAGQQQKAIGVYESLSKLEPENLTNRIALAEMKLKHGKVQEAAAGFVDLARELDAKGQAKESARVYEMALKAGGGDPAVAEGLCLALSASGQHEKAISVANELLAKRPDQILILAAKGQALAALGKKDDAEAALRKVLEKEPKRWATAFMLAPLLAEKGKIADAHAALAGALDTALAGGQGLQMAAAIEQVLAASPAHRPLLSDLYRVQAFLGNKAGTVVAGEKLVQACTEQGLHEEALNWARRLADLEPQAATHRMRVAHLEARRGEPAPAPRGAVPEVEAEVELADEAVEEIAGDGDVTPAAARPAWDTEPEIAAPAAAAGDGQASELDEDAPGFVPTEMPDLDVGVEERVLGPDDEDFISEHLTEAEVFVKYGLADRAIEQLGAIVERYPWHLASRQKLRDVFLEEGSRARAANESAAMARILFESGDGAGAQAAIAEARSIDAACPAIQEVEALLGGTERVAPPAHATPPRRAAIPPREAAPADEGDLVIEEEETIEESRATPSTSGPAEEDLQEFDFYLSQGMHAEAAACLSRMESVAGPHPALEERRAALGRVASETAPPPAPGPVESFEDVVSLEDVASLEEPQAPEAAEPPAAAEAVEAEIPEPVVEEVVEASAALVAPAAGSPAGGGGAADFFDLASEMDPDLFAAQDTSDERKALAGIEASPEGHSLDEIVTAFKKGIEQQVGAEDFETHYNLGIAYKEMGLLEEAIGEFQFASKDPRLLPDCCSMLGICFRDKGMPSLAVKWYRKGLDAVASGGDEERLNGIRFDLAEVLDQMGESRQALDIYVEIYGSDSRYRDVAGRIKDLKTRLAG